MGMEPFVQADDNAFGHLVASIPNPVDNLRQAIAFKVGLAQKQAETQQATAQAAQVAQKLSRAQMFQQDLGAVQANPSPGNVSALMMKYPEFSDQIKGAWDLKDKAQRDADLTSIGQVYTPALSGDWQTAQKAAHARYDADKAAGQTTPDDDQFIQQMDAAASGDKNAQKAVLTSLGFHAAAAAGADHFATVYGALKGGYTLDAGATRYDENGNIVAQSPFLKVGDRLAERDGANGTPAPAGATPQPSSAPGGDQGFDKAIAFTLRHEGGFNPHDMNGAPVNFGINQAANPGVDVKNLTPEEATQIYRTKYWDKSGAANLPADMQTPYFDTYIINPSRAQQFLKASGGDPAKFMQLRENWMDQVAEKNPQYAKAYQTRNADLRLTMQGQGGAPDQGGPAAASSDADAPPPGYHWITPPTNSPDQYRTLSDAEVKQRGLDPAQQYQLNTKTGQVTGLGQKTSGDDVLSRYNIAPGETGPAMLSKLPASMASQVKALAEGRLPMPSSFALAKPYWQSILQLTSQYDPSFDASSFPARKAAITAFTGMGKGAQVVSSVNRVANHLQLLWNESNKLAGPDTGFGPLNTALATAGQAFEPQDAKAYDTEVQFIAGELEKIARNSPGTVSGVNDIIKNLSRKQSTSTRQAAIRAAVGIISGAVDPLKDQYNSAFTNDATRPNIPWVSPHAQQIYRNIGGVDMSLTGANAGTNASGDSATSLPRLSPADAAKLPPGTEFLTLDGRKMRKR